MSDRYKFFGEIALEKRFVSADQLYEALTLQARNRVEGVIEKQLGQLLLELVDLDAPVRGVFLPSRDVNTTVQATE